MALPSQNHRTQRDIAATLEQLRFLADHPGLIQKRLGRRPLDGLRDLPSDRRRRTTGSQSDRYMADYTSPWNDQDNNYGSGLL